MQAPRDDSMQRSPINVGQDERRLSLLGGVGLMLFALRGSGVLRIPALLAGAALLYRGATGSSPLYEGLNRNTAVKTNPQAVSVPHEQGIHVTRAVTINRPVAELYNFWRDLTNLPRIIKFVDSVEPLGDNRSHWKVKLPGDIPVEWDAETYTDVPNEVISWRSLPDSQIQNAGSVRFVPAPAGRGTEIHLTIEFVPPLSPISQPLIKLFGDVPNQYVAQALRQFKQMMETGEIATNSGQPSGREKEQHQ